MVLASSCAQPSSSLAAGGNESPEEDASDASAGGSAGAGGGDQGQGAGGSGLDAGGAGGSDAQDAGPDAAAPFEEPDGPPSLVLLNGIVDRSSIRLCLLPWEGSAPITTTPVSPTSAIDYGGHVAGVLPDGYDPETTALRPLIITSQHYAPTLDCATLWSAPPVGMRVSALPVLPAGTFSAPRALLLVAAGCVGGGESSVLACGQDVTATKGNPTLVLAQLSRVAPPKDRMGLQVVQASVAMGKLNVQAVAYGMNSARVITNNVNLGQIAPRPPTFIEIEATFGTPAKWGQLLVTNAQTGAYYGHFRLDAALAAGGLHAPALAPGKGLVAVVIGPLPEAADAGIAPTDPRVVLLEAPALP